MSLEIERQTVPPADNIRTLVYYLGLEIDGRLSAFRRGTPYEHVRPSDIRLFVAAARSQKTISALARELKITRQAAQMGVQRLVKLGVLELLPVPDNKRDKLVAITPKGLLARNTAAQQIMRLENEFAALIGVEGLETFRQNLSVLLTALLAHSATDA